MARATRVAISTRSASRRRPIPAPSSVTHSTSLQRQLRTGDEDQLDLNEDAIRLPHGVFYRDSLQGFNIMGELPQDGGLLLIGDEILAYRERGGLGILELAEGGRGLFDTEPGHHDPGSTVTFLSDCPGFAPRVFDFSDTGIRRGRRRARFPVEWSRADRIRADPLRP